VIAYAIQATLNRNFVVYYARTKVFADKVQLKREEEKNLILPEWLQLVRPLLSLNFDRITSHVSLTVTIRVAPEVDEDNPRLFHDVVCFEACFHLQI
jgi:hypothetical protein